MHKINGAVTLRGPEHIVVRRSSSTTSTYIPAEKSKIILGTHEPQLQKLKLRPVKSENSSTHIQLNNAISLSGSLAWKEWYETKLKEKKEKEKIEKEKRKEMEEYEKEKKNKLFNEQKLNFEAWLLKKRNKDLEEKQKLQEKLELNKRVSNISTKVKDSVSREKVRAWAEQKYKEDQIKREQELELERKRQEIARNEEKTRLHRNATAWSDWAERAKMRPKPNKILLKPIVYNQRRFEKKLRESGVWINPEPWCCTFAENDQDSDRESSHIHPKTAPSIAHYRTTNRNPIRGIST